MTTRPTDDIEWGTDASAEVTEPATAVKRVGFVFRQALAQAHFNWLLRGLWRWIAYFDAGVDPDRGWKYSGDGVTMTYHMPPVLDYAWTLTTLDYNRTATPPTVTVNTAGAATYTAYYNLSPQLGVNDDASDVPTTVATLGWTAKRNTGATLQLSLIRVKIDGSAAIDVVQTIDAPVSGSLTSTDEIVEHAIDAAYVYFLKMKMAVPAAGAGTVAETELWDVRIALRKTRVE